MTRWHVSEQALDSWVSGAADLVTGASVEQHLLGCDHCRSRVGPARSQTPVVLPAPDLEEVWQGIADRIEPQPLPAPARWFARLGLRESDARLVSVAPALTTAWLGALTVVLAFTVVAAATAPERALVLFLLVAPLAPLAGVAAAYGVDADPTYEVTLAAPYSKLRLLLLRTGAVAVGCVPLTVAAGLLGAGPWWVSVVWLVPALAFVLVTLAAATFVPVMYAAGVVATGWVAVATLPLVRQDPRALTSPALLIVLTVLAGGAAVLFVARRGHLATDRWLP